MKKRIQRISIALLVIFSGAVIAWSIQHNSHHQTLTDVAILLFADWQIAEFVLNRVVYVGSMSVPPIPEKAAIRLFSLFFNIAVWCLATYDVVYGLKK